MTVKELREILNPDMEDAYSDDTEVFINTHDYPFVYKCHANPYMIKDDMMDKNGKVALVFTCN